MEFCNEKIIENLYHSDLVTDIDTNEEYNALIHEYNSLFDTIEDTKLKEKLVKLNELKNELYGENNKHIFTVGFSMATKMLLEALTYKM